MTTRFALAIALLVGAAGCFARASTPRGRADGWRTPAILLLIAGLLSLALAIVYYLTGYEE